MPIPLYHQYRSCYQLQQQVDLLRTFRSQHHILKVRNLSCEIDPGVGGGFRWRILSWDSGFERNGEESIVPNEPETAAAEKKMAALIPNSSLRNQQER